MKILVAPASFKGSMTAYQAACCIEKGLKEAMDKAVIDKLAVADGGEGTVEALVESTSGTIVGESARDPLGKPVRARYGILGDRRTAVVEMANASGLTLVPLDARNPMTTTTYGTGELIAHALSHGLRRIILGAGGSATVDGGLGMAQALGIRFLDERGKDLPCGGQGLSLLKDIDCSHIHPALSEAEVEIACDVLGPLTGTNGAARVYGPQKGATPEMVIALEKGLEVYVEVLERVSGRKLASVPGTGAGGGVAVPLLAFARAKIRRGIDIVLDACEFEKRLQHCHLVITGEGCLDLQTRAGKAPLGVAQRAKARGIPVIALCGRIGQGAESLHDEGITAFLSSLEGPLREQDLAEKGPEMLQSCARQLGRILRLKFP